MILKNVEKIGSKKSSFLVSEKKSEYEILLIYVDNEFSKILFVSFLIDVLKIFNCLR